MILQFRFVEKLYVNQIKQFGLVVRQLRETNSFTQLELADKCEVDIRTIQRIERGDSGIGLHILFALSNAFGLPPAELLKNIKMEDI